MDAWMVSCWMDASVDGLAAGLKAVSYNADTVL